MYEDPVAPSVLLVLPVLLQTRRGYGFEESPRRPHSVSVVAKPLALIHRNSPGLYFLRTLLCPCKEGGNLGRYFLRTFLSPDSKDEVVGGSFSGLFLVRLNRRRFRLPF